MGYFSQGIKKRSQNQSSYERAQEAMLKPLADKASAFVMQWFLTNITKYGEHGFHMKLAGTYVDVVDRQRYQGFDFIYDMATFHPREFQWLMGIAAKGVDMVIYDINDMTNRLVNVLNTRYGWRLFPHEISCINRTLLRVNQLIHTKSKQTKHSFL